MKKESSRATVAGGCNQAAGIARTFLGLQPRESRRDNRECYAFSDNGQVHVPEPESVPTADNYCVVTELRRTLRLPPL
ncbi:hypothetical protein KQX54_008701 [Cotesia glomerata]|uniref:Uncharacterized protein n=1 Tax=Cotesia glomerata TaxID=32391 RepID=A0AAV7I1J9_COTGL|nr:hypothetical protein KQX54_008701 [Cotesia glomerata]